MLEIKTTQLTAAAARITALGGSLEGELRDGTRKVEPAWKRLVASNASTRIEKRIIAQGARAIPTSNGVRLESTGGRARNGLNAADHGGAVEFGVKRGKKSTYRRRSKRGGTHTVTRVTTNGLKAFRATGHVFTPSLKTFIPLLKKAWVDEVVEAAEEALTGRG